MDRPSTDDQTGQTVAPMAVEAVDQAPPSGAPTIPTAPADGHVPESGPATAGVGAVSTLGGGGAAEVAGVSSSQSTAEGGAVDSVVSATNADAAAAAAAASSSAIALDAAPAESPEGGGSARMGWSQLTAEETAVDSIETAPVVDKAAPPAAQPDSRRSKRARKPLVRLGDEEEEKGVSGAPNEDDGEMTMVDQGEELEEEEEDDGMLYCICRGPDDGEEPMIKCDFCDDWFHYSCVKLTVAKVKKMKEDTQWYCPACEAADIAGEKTATTTTTKPTQAKKSKKKEATASKKSKVGSAPSKKAKKAAPKSILVDAREESDDDDDNIAAGDSDDDYAPDDTVKKGTAAPKTEPEAEVTSPVGLGNNVQDAFFALLAQSKGKSKMAKPVPKQPRPKPRARVTSTSSEPHSPQVPIARVSPKKATAEARAKFAGTITAMVKRSRAKGAVEQSDSIGQKVEAALYELYDGSIEDAYLRHIKRLAANLRKNTALTERLLSGELNATSLVRMSPEELGTEEVLKAREMAKEKAMQAVAVVPTEIKVITHNDKDHDRQVKDDVTFSVVHERAAPTDDAFGESEARTTDDSQSRNDATPMYDSDDEPPSASPEGAPIEESIDVANVVLPTSRSAGVTASVVARSSSMANASSSPTNTNVASDHSTKEVPTVWTGVIKNGSHTKVHISAKVALLQNEHVSVSGLLPTTLEVAGRIRPSEVWGYLEKMLNTEGGSREVAVLALTPKGGDDEDVDFISLHSYFHSRQRIGVINTRKMSEIKDMYLVPLSKRTPLPKAFTSGSMLSYGLDLETDDSLVAVITRSASKKRKRDSVALTRPAKASRNTKKSSPRVVDDEPTLEAPYLPHDDTDAPVDAPYSPTYKEREQSKAKSTDEPPTPPPPVQQPGPPYPAVAVTVPTGASYSAPPPSGAGASFDFSSLLSTAPSAASEGAAVDLGSISSLLTTLNQRATTSNAAAPPPPPSLQRGPATSHSAHMGGVPMRADPFGQQFGAGFHGNRGVHPPSDHRGPGAPFGASGGYRHPPQQGAPAYPPPPHQQGYGQGGQPRQAPPQGSFTQRQYTKY